MITYILYLLPVFFSPLLVIKNKKIACFSLLFLFIFSVFFWGLREGIGNDYQGTINLLTSTYLDFTIRIREPFFYLVYFFDSSFGANGKIFIFLYSLLTVGLTMLAFNNREDALEFFILLNLVGFIFFANDQLRQALGYAVFVFSTTLVSKNNKLNFKLNLLISALVACFFHFSFFVFVGIALITCLMPMISRSRIYLVAPLCGLIIYLLNPIEILNFILSFNFPDAIINRFLYNERFLNLNRTGTSLSIVIWLLIYYLFLIISKKHKNEHSYLLHVNFLSIGLFFYIVFFDVFLLARAFSTTIYILIFYIVMYADREKTQINKNLSINNSVKYTFIVLCSFLIFFSYLFNEGGRHGGFPYNNIIGF